MFKKFSILIIISLLFLPYFQVSAETPGQSFRIMTESDFGDYIGQNKSWDFSNANDSVISVVSADEKTAVFDINDSAVSSMRFEFASKTGQNLTKGLYVPAKRYAFRGVDNGINISGDGRGCNTILGSFYVHEYVVNNGEVEKAAIDFVQICEPKSGDVNENSPKLYGSLRYGSSVPDSCNSQGCDVARNNLGVTKTTGNTPATTPTPGTVQIISNPTTEAYKSIVKVMTYSEDPNGKVYLNSTGSGVIVDSSGLVLTNYHVINVEDEEFAKKMNAGYAVCLTENISNEPDCSYYGTLVSGNKELDLAILKINLISGVSTKSSFDYLKINSSDTTKVNDEVTSYGYPGIGSDTITITKGIISGKMDKYNNKWIKTDAVISFGSSGGAALDTNDNIVGITSSAHSDLLGSLGYVISVESINDWYSGNKNKSPERNFFTDKVVNFIVKKLSLEKTDKFTNSVPSFEITKPADWNFTQDSETDLSITKNLNEVGGEVTISVMEYPYKVTLDNVEGFIKRQLDQVQLLSVVTITKNENVVVAEKNVRLVEMSAFGQKFKSYYLPVDNYFIEIGFDYGENDQDKSIVENIIKSFKLNSSANSFVEMKSYSQEDPKFSLTVDNNWVLQTYKLYSHPLVIGYKKNANIFGDIQIEKAESEVDNDEYLLNYTQKIKEINILLSVLDDKIEIVSSDAHFNVSDSLKDVVMLEYVEKSIATGVIFSRNINYIKIIGDKNIVISVNSYDSSENNYNIAKSDLTNLLKNFKTDGTVSPASGNGLNGASTSNVAGEVNIKDKAMYSRLKGKIMLKVEDYGKAYYVNPKKEIVHYLGHPDDAFSVMKEQGVGITNNDLYKIPVGVNDNSIDTDGDGLSEYLENTLGLNSSKRDTDGDGIGDKEELISGQNPWGEGKQNIDNIFSSKQKGKILLQVENNGEAWYVNPTDGKRYFLGRPADAFNVMRDLGLGISNKDFNSLVQ